MKKFLGLAFGLLLTVFTYAQSHVTFNDAASGYDKTAVTTFHFTFDGTFKLDDLNNNAAYYTDYFSVAVEAKDAGFSVTITLAQDDEMSRRVITRYMVTNKVEHVTVNGTDLALDEFMGDYIML
ncbi:MAG: hypothetical protein R2780_01290 [Crocinitomicaceae bacterium]